DLEPRTIAGPVVVDSSHAHGRGQAGDLGVVAGLDAEPSVTHASERADLVDERQRHLRGDRKRQALAVLAHGGGDAEHAALHVDERAAGVADVDRRVGLDERPDAGGIEIGGAPEDSMVATEARDHRSEETRLNSSHVKNSYAVFCLEKKEKPGMCSV